MDTQPLFGRQQLLSHIISDMAQALCQRRDEPQSRQIARAQAAAESIVGFQPSDAVEAMIAGHCVMFHELIVDSAQITLQGELDATRRATRSGIVAMDKAFGANLVRLEQYRARHADSTEHATPADVRAETEIADRVHRHQSGSASTAEAIPPFDAPQILGMPGLNRQARRAMGRQSRERIDPATSSIANANIGRHIHS
jgi:hypothetical protein